MASRSEANMEDLPKFIMEDILLRLPTKSVLRARSVSRFWLKTIDDPRFRVMLKPDVRIILGCDLCDEAISLITVTGPEGVIEAKKMAIFQALRGYCLFPRNCCNGLIYTKICNDDKVDGAVLNPFSGKVVKVWELAEHSFYDERALGFDATTRTYKLVRVFSGRRISAAVYSFKTSLWAPCEDPPFMIGDCGVYLSRSGSLNWLPNKSIIIIKSLISFDLRKEKFGLIRLPLPENQVYLPSVHIFECDGRLGLCNRLTEANLDVWILDDFEGQEWSKRHRISVPISARPLSRPCRVLGVHSDKKILIATSQTLFSYDLENDEVTTLGDAELVAAVPLFCRHQILSHCNKKLIAHLHRDSFLFSAYANYFIQNLFYVKFKKFACT